MEPGLRGVEAPNDYSRGVKVNDTTDTCDGGAILLLESLTRKIYPRGIFTSTI